MNSEKITLNGENLSRYLLEKKIIEQTNGLNYLRELHLDNNQIASLEANTFYGLNNLWHLYLANNQIASIDANTFNGLKNLIWLHLENNQISSIDANAFNGLNNLWHLYLGFNQIASLDANTFNGLSSLNELGLDGNPFDKIENASNKTFKGIKYLMLFDKSECLFYPNAQTIESDETTFTLTKDNCKEKLCTRKIENILTLCNESLSRLELSNTEHKSLKANFKWASIRPDVSVLIGENGCGKTTLLTLIDECLQKDTFELKHYTHKYFTSMERVVNPNENEKSFDSFNKELSLRINSSSFDGYNLSDCLYDSINYFSSILYFDYLLSLYDFNLDEFNEYLAENDFKYQFNKEKCKQRRTTQKEIEQELLEDKKKRKETNFYQDLNPRIESYFHHQPDIRLSPGEDLLLLILLWSFHAKLIKKGPRISLPVKSKKRIVLLDEPDAHMHPRLIKKFIDLILHSDVFKYLNLQLIMTTHNPLTLSFVPIENVFIVSNESVTEPEGYVQTIQLLTHNLISLNKPFRLVFVEANDDKTFYEMILNKLEMLHFVLKVPISFQCLPGIKPSKDTQAFNQMTVKKESMVKDLLNLISGNPAINIDEEVKNIIENVDLIIGKVSQVNNETKEKVKQIVREFRPSKEADNSTSVPNYLPNETFFGIVDGDDEKIKNEPHIIYTEQFSLENYVLTPLTIFLLANRFLKNHGLIKEILQETKLSDKDINSIGDILKQKNGIEIIQMIFDKITETLIVHINRKLKIYQNVLNEPNDVDRKPDEKDRALEFEKYYSDKNKSKRLKQTQLFTFRSFEGSYAEISLKKALPKQKVSRGSIAKDDTKELPKEPVEYIYSKSELFKIDVAQFLLKMKGKWLQEFYEEIFPDLKTELLKLAELKGRKETDSLCRLTLDYQIKVLKNNEDIILLPKELKQHFQLIQGENVKDNDNDFLVTYLKEIKKKIKVNLKRTF
jgi:hypothetical protein